MRRVLVLILAVMLLAAGCRGSESGTPVGPGASVGAPESPLNSDQVRGVLSDMLPAAADLPWTVTLAAEEFQDHAAGAEQGPFANFDLVQARWRADLDRIFLVSELADQLRDGTVDTSAGAGGVLAVQVSASYFDDAAGASRAMAILESASAEALAGLPGTAGLPLELTEFAIAVGDASRGITFTSPPGTLAVPLPVRTDVVAFQRGRILVGVVIFAVAPADPGAAVVARMLDARISSGLARLPAGEPEPQDAEQRAARTALEQAQARWQDAGLADYQFRFVRYCECPAAWGGPFDVDRRRRARCRVPTGRGGDGCGCRDDRPPALP